MELTEFVKLVREYLHAEDVFNASFRFEERKRADLWNAMCDKREAVINAIREITNDRQPGLFGEEAERGED